MIDEKFIYLAALINFIGGMTYVVDTLKGKTKPNKVTWFLWALAPLIAFSAQVSQGVGLIALMTFIVGFDPLLVFAASFVNKKAQLKITKFDLLCGILSVSGIILWGITKVGNIAILFAILADLLAGLPTVIKAYKEPETESYQIFLLGAIAAVISMLTIKTWSFVNYAFTLYIFSFCFSMVLLVKFKLGKRLTKV